MSNLELMLQGTIIDLGVEGKKKKKLLGILNTIKEKDYETYKHSIRVGLICVQMAKYLGLEPKPLFYGGSTHDVGKVNQDKELLVKKGHFDEEDREQMKKHPLDGYKFLKNVFKFTAQIVVRHHLEQKDPYPKELPEECKKYPTKQTAIIQLYARLVGIADFYDAITTRDNVKYGEKKLTSEEKKQIILDNYPNNKDLILRLYEAHIFGDEKRYAE